MAPDARAQRHECALHVPLCYILALAPSFLYFYIEGTVFSWANPEDRPFSVQLPSVPAAAYGAEVSTPVHSVAIAGQPSPTVMEGQAFPVQPTIRVTDETGAGVAGRKVFALVAEANGFVCVARVLAVSRVPPPQACLCVPVLVFVYTHARAKVLRCFGA